MYLTNRRPKRTALHLPLSGDSECILVGISRRFSIRPAGLRNGVLRCDWPAAVHGPHTPPSLSAFALAVVRTRLLNALFPWPLPQLHALHLPPRFNASPHPRPSQPFLHLPSGQAAGAALAVVLGGSTLRAPVVTLSGGRASGICSRGYGPSPATGSSWLPRAFFERVVEPSTTSQPFEQLTGGRYLGKVVRLTPVKGRHAA